MGFDEVLRLPSTPSSMVFVGDSVEFLRPRWAVRARRVPPSSASSPPRPRRPHHARGAAARRSGGGHRRPATRALAAASALWVLAALLSIDTAAGQPWAARTASADAVFRTEQVDAGLRDRAAFEAQARVDAFSGVPAADLLTGLRGKTVILAFVESYGRSAVQDPALTPLIDPALTAGAARA